MCDISKVICITLVLVLLVSLLSLFIRRRQLREDNSSLPASKRNVPLYFLTIQTTCPQNYDLDYDWILHHLRLGVDHFFVYAPVIQKLKEPYDHFITLVPTYKSLEDNFKNCVCRFGELSVWIASIDVHEFIMANDGLPSKLNEAQKKSGETTISVACQGNSQDRYLKHILCLEAFIDNKRNQDFAFQNFNTRTYYDTSGEATNKTRFLTSASLQNNETTPATHPSIKDHLTIVITTAPSLCNGSLRIIRITLESLRSYSDLRGVHLIVGFDGIHVDEAAPVHYKCSTLYSEYVYDIYKKSVKAYVSLLFDSYEFIELERRSCLTTLLKTSMDKVRTRYVLIMQEDLSLVGDDKIDFGSLIEAMEANPNELGIINLRAWPSNAYHIEWETGSCDKTTLEKIPRKKIRRGDLEFNTSRCYSDQVHLSTKDFYDRNVWPVVPDFDFMEHHLNCGRLRPTNQIWDLGKESDFYTVHNDTRQTCSSN